jgi:hypothetical protein
MQRKFVDILSEISWRFGTVLSYKEAFSLISDVFPGPSAQNDDYTFTHNSLRIDNTINLIETLKKEI